ncbi:MAG: hypothetical protein P0S94_02180 [Simkaniaceae bacterium]|nr:hypothetical protein [Simkaniaceae bacterium]
MWLMEPLSAAQTSSLSAILGKDKLRRFNRKARFDERFIQRIVTHQPAMEALEYLRGLNSIHLNRVDISLDLVFENQEELARASEIFCKTHVKPHHRDQGVRFYKGSRYSGQKWQHPQVCLNYSDKKCRITGHEFCLHIDWCMTGKQTLRRAGLSTISEIMNLDYRQFWRDRLVFKSVIPEQLGRLYHNHQKSTKRRKPWVHECKNGFKYDMDKSYGNFIIRHLGSTQTIIDKYRKKLRLDSCLCGLKESHLLPSSSYD